MRPIAERKRNTFLTCELCCSSRFFLISNVLALTREQTECERNFDCCQTLKQIQNDTKAFLSIFCVRRSFELISRVIAHVSISIVISSIEWRARINFYLFCRSMEINFRSFRHLKFDWLKWTKSQSKMCLILVFFGEFFQNWNLQFSSFLGTSRYGRVFV